MRRMGFTLIELLVVVAIIAILATIALPNMLEAQTRSKVARAKNDLRTVATALEAYATDHNSYPPSGPLLPSRLRRLRPLTQPVQYLSEVPRDPFENDNGRYEYRGTPIDKPNTWVLSSDGPDHVDTITEFFGFPFPDGIFDPATPNFYDLFYDPTNGTISRGDIARAKDYRTP